MVEYECPVDCEWCEKKFVWLSKQAFDALDFIQRARREWIDFHSENLPIPDEFAAIATTRFWRRVETAKRHRAFLDGLEDEAEDYCECCDKCRRSRERVR